MTSIEMPETQYAQSGDLSIAYQLLGDGPIDVVYVSGFISHQELAWELPIVPIRRIASFARLITFDKRGTGLSERTLGFGAAEDRMDDIRAVMDAAGSERAALVGISDGGPLAVLFAATYPERTSALVLWATYARGLAGPDYTIGYDERATKELIAGVADSWGTGHGIEAFLGVSIEDVETAYYLRLMVTDKAGVLAEVTRILSDAGISIEAILQKPVGDRDRVPVIILTRRVLEKKMNAALAKIAALPEIDEEIMRIRLESLDH